MEVRVEYRIFKRMTEMLLIVILLKLSFVVVLPSVESMLLSSNSIFETKNRNYEAQ